MSLCLPRNSVTYGALPTLQVELHVRLAKLEFLVENRCFVPLNVATVQHADVGMCSRFFPHGQVVDR